MHSQRETREARGLSVLIEQVLELTRYAKEHHAACALDFNAALLAKVLARRSSSRQSFVDD